MIVNQKKYLLTRKIVKTKNTLLQHKRKKNKKMCNIKLRKIYHLQKCL
jgi:tRNA U34 2-thiouridine synthase MnmA/TrmU